ncbi:MAG: hypothetical protein AABW85_00070 [archaeon]
MQNDNYLYTGIGLISVFIIAAFAFIAVNPEVKENTAKIIIELQEQNHSKEFSFYTTKKQLFSENSTINFSSAQNGFSFYADDFKCEISCKKEE